jgi:hypothetical protein
MLALSLRPAAIHDYLKGRRTETGDISGLVARKGKGLGIPVPLNTAVANSYPIFRTKLENEMPGQGRRGKLSHPIWKCSSNSQETS